GRPDGAWWLGRPAPWPGAWPRAGPPQRVALDHVDYVRVFDVRSVAVLEERRNALVPQLENAHALCPELAARIARDGHPSHFAVVVRRLLAHSVTSSNSHPSALSRRTMFTPFGACRSFSQ